ncbi:MAG: N-acetylmuramoyl-L-alanine amidase [Candidatus Obscuribacter sp.]|nr:N-acetylmuramoyl-L-alanine amidase [Candidatus Obscuribacter sp.]
MFRLEFSPKGGLLHVVFQLSLALTLLVPSLSATALAQGYAPSYKSVRSAGIKVLSIEERTAERTIYVKLAREAVVGRPLFNYLPGEGGDTILTADFEGLSSNLPSRVIRLNSPENRLNREARLSGIKEIHFAEIQADKPRLRFSFVARDPQILKSVAVGTAPGLLKITWGAAEKTVAKNEAPPLAPPIKKSSAAGSRLEPESRRLEKSKEKLEKADTRPKAGWFSRLKERTLDMIGLSDEKSQLEGEGSGAVKDGLEPAGSGTRTVAPDTVAEGNAQPADENRREVVDYGPPPLITLEKADAMGSGAKLEIFRVEMPAGKELTYKSFRLKNPDRYVMDIPDLRSIANASLPDVLASPLVRSIRVGIPNADNGVGRLVLELEDGVNVDELFHSGSTYMTMTLSKGLSGGGGGVSSSTSIAAGPIVVPRAPDETVIVLDAGHGGSDPGAQRADVNEKDVTMAIINKLKKVLEGKGARVVLTRADDTFISLEERVRITNQVNPNLFLSVHINSLQSTSDIHGIETYYQTDRSLPLANRVHESLVTGLAAPDRSVRRARFYVINHTPVPAILAEVGYITNKTERDRLISSDYQHKIANALARGVMLYLQDANKGTDALAKKHPSQLATSGSAKVAK